MSRKTIELRNQEKQLKFDEWMQGDHVLVHLDSRKPGTSVPEHLTNNYSVTLKLSYKFHGETLVDKEKISSYLRFSGSYFQCIIPWSAVWGLTSEKGDNIIWPEDLSSELLLQMAASRIKEIGGKLFNKKKQTSDEPTEPSPDEPAKKQPSEGPGKVHPFLRRIK